MKLRSRESNPGAQAYETRWDVRSHSASKLWSRQDSNLRPLGSEPSALIPLSYGTLLVGWRDSNPLEPDSQTGGSPFAFSQHQTSG